MRSILVLASMLVVLSACHRKPTPAPPAATAPVAAATAMLPLPQSEPIATKPTAGARNKTAPAVLAPIVNNETRAPAGGDYGNRDDNYNRNNNSNRDNGDPCAGLDDRALDDCLARDDLDNQGPDRGSIGRDDGATLDRPELEPRDRALIEDEDAARDRDVAGPQDQLSDDYPPPDEDGPPDEDSAPDDDSPEDVLPDQDPDQPPPDDPYYRR
jgi:hypothetical protein